ncbi:hypothetical protein U1Q18_045393 [Sarracenia purpurea var. burkii]
MGLLLPFATSTTKVVSSWNCSQGEEEAVEELVARKNVNALGIYFAEWDTWTQILLSMHLDSIHLENKFCCFINKMLFLFFMPNETRGPTSPRYLQLSTRGVWGPCCSLVPARRWPVALQAAALREEKGEAEALLTLSLGESKSARCSRKLKAQNPVVPSLTGL